MKKRENKTIESDGLPPSSHQLAELAAVSGAVAGGVVGAIGGPVGVVIGSALGGAVGTAAGIALTQVEHDKATHDADLDEQIGVISGDLGAASPDAPKARIGAFSAASSGAGATESTAPAEGLIQPIED